MGFRTSRFWLPAIPLSCHPNYRALTFALAGLTPAEHTSLSWLQPPHQLISGRDRIPYQGPLYGASVVKRRFSFFSTLSLSPILLFGPGGAILPPLPLVPRAGARSGGQGWPAFGPPRQRRAASLTAASTTAGCVDSGATHFASLVRAFRNRAKGAGRRTVAESGLGLTSRVMRQLQPTKSEASSPLRWGADRAPRPCIRSILWGSNEP